jgi:hypothetical protein
VRDVQNQFVCQPWMYHAYGEQKANQRIDGLAITTTTGETRSWRESETCTTFLSTPTMHRHDNDLQPGWLDSVGLPSIFGRSRGAILSDTPVPVSQQFHHKHNSSLFLLWPAATSEMTNASYHNGRDRMSEFYAPRIPVVDAMAGRRIEELERQLDDVLPRAGVAVGRCPSAAP